MPLLPADDPLALQTIAAIRAGDVATLRVLLDRHPELAAARILGAPAMCPEDMEGRSLLHVATDWPGHFPNGPAVVRLLVECGADVNATYATPKQSQESPLHWAASSDDVAVLLQLLDCGADIEQPGAVIDGGPALSDAVGFAQWRAAWALVARGALVNLWHAAALGLEERLCELLDASPSPDADDLNGAFWCACHGAQRHTAQLLLDRGADRNWVGYDHLTPYHAAMRQKAGDEYLGWLKSMGCV